MNMKEISIKWCPTKDMVADHQNSWNSW
jgi:hypothetical protein